MNNSIELIHKYDKEAEEATDAVLVNSVIDMEARLHILRNDLTHSGASEELEKELQALGFKYLSYAQMLEIRGLS